MPFQAGNREGPKTIAYLRVSTDKQDLDSQKLEVLSFAQKHQFKFDKIIEMEISSRKSPAERKIDELLTSLKKGDTLVVTELSRLGRSLGQIIKIVDVLVKGEIRFLSLKEGLEINGKQNMQSKIMVVWIGLFAELERDLISQRTIQGLRAAREKGKILGRPKGPGKSKLDNHRPEIEALLKNGSTKTFIARRYGTSLPNLHNWLKKNGIAVNPVLVSAVV